MMEPILLTEALPEKSYVVREIKDETRLVNRLSSMGIMRGSQIKVCMNNKKQPVLVFVRDTLVAIGRSESKKIMVGGTNMTESYYKDGSDDLPPSRSEGRYILVGGSENE